jgi:wobble nucleotide-excising tRNase
MELKKFNIIYGENGRGKSTITTILRSLCLGEPTYVSERATVDSNSKQEVHILLDNLTTVDFRDGKWNKQLPNLEIFDNNFVSDNIYSGNSIEIDHKKNLHQFVIGTDGVKYIKSVNICDRAL